MRHVRLNPIILDAALPVPARNRQSRCCSTLDTTWVGLFTRRRDAPDTRKMASSEALRFPLALGPPN